MIDALIYTSDPRWKAGGGVEWELVWKSELQNGNGHRKREWGAQ
jgi:hypothetical protein